MWMDAHRSEVAAGIAGTQDDIFCARDSENDLEAFKLTGKGIAVEPFSEVLRPAAWRTVGKLAEIRDIL
jgi:hydroxymethylpyrimidine pyrophosphatase-like HAD family hydrolase